MNSFKISNHQNFRVEGGQINYTLHRFKYYHSDQDLMLAFIYAIYTGYTHSTLTKRIIFPSTGNPVPDPVELKWLSCVFVRAIRATVSGLVGERFLSGVRVADSGHWVAAQRQTYVQGESGPEQPVVRWPPAQTTEDSDQHHGQWIKRHVV